MIARTSFLEAISTQRIARLSTEVRRESLLNDKKWEWHCLRKQCKDLELEHFYQSYMQRLRIRYLTLFLIINVVVGGVHSFMPLSLMPDLKGELVHVFLYIITTVLVMGVLAINFHEELIASYPWAMYATSCIAVIILTMVNTGITMYHAVIDSELLMPAYGSYILYAVYIFLPLADNLHAFILGMAVTIWYLISFAVVSSQQLSYGAITFGFDKLIIEMIFLLSTNILGIYFRLTKEIAIRIAFLDRYQLVHENVLLRFARGEEQHLLLSIIPKHIVNKIEHHVKSRLQQLMVRRRSSPWSNVLNRRQSYSRQPESQELFIEPHENVSILYADVVNYTSLTSTLDVKTLVETLHDLFFKFDTASQKYNVLRIKFLGDCYYAVAGLSAPNEDHAKCCVDLGLLMIKDLRDIRRRRKLEIDMRIGVHTGTVFSGVLGASKLQYDIWSRDVDIANRLEQTGIPGRVHVSEETLKHLKGQYIYEEGTPQAREDPILNEFGIRTYLIEPLGNGQDRPLDDDTYEFEEVSSDETSSHFIKNNINESFRLQLQAEMEMCRELDKMPLAKIRDYTSLFLYHKDWSLGMEYLSEPDEMLNYSVTISFILFFGILVTQWINKVDSPHTFYIVLMIVLMFITWFKKLWRLLFAETAHSIPKNIFILFLFNVSMKIKSSITARIVIYLLISLTYCSSTLLQLFDCKSWAIYPDSNWNQRSLQDRARSQKCEMSFYPWGITKSLEMTICMMFLFSRIPVLLKLILGIFITIAYSIVIFGKYYIVYSKSPTTDYGLSAEYAHVLIIVITLMIFYIMDGQTEFISQLDFNLRLQLQKKQEDAEITNASITMLVNNILPSHVADIYISKRIANELYYEEYDNVAVMFATIKKYDIDSIGLGVLNEIICHFDGVLKRFEAEGVFKVEKIKLAGWTYMAACGLNLGRSYHVNSRNLYRTLDGNRIRKSSEDTGNIKRRSINTPRHDYVVYVMASFALDLMQTLNAMNKLNMQNLQLKNGYNDYGLLRVGISNGPTMAGVIGSSKPHYDIWGNCVNMASRMDSTGVPGSIQVTEETAEILRTFEIQCNFRGLTFVKGYGEIPTYFIGIDEDLNFARSQKSRRSTF